MKKIARVFGVVKFVLIPAGLWAFFGGPSTFQEWIDYVIHIPGGLEMTTTRCIVAVLCFVGFLIIQYWPRIASWWTFSPEGGAIVKNSTERLKAPNVQKQGLTEKDDRTLEERAQAIHRFRTLTLPRALEAAATSTAAESSFTFRPTRRQNTIEFEVTPEQRQAFAHNPVLKEHVILDDIKHMREAISGVVDSAQKKQGTPGHAKPYGTVVTEEIVKMWHDGLYEIEKRYGRKDK